MASSTQEAQIEGRYRETLQIIFQDARGTRIDKLDDYLIGITKQLPPIEEQNELQQAKLIHVQNKLLQSILHFPIRGAGVLEEFIPGRTYSLLTLLCLLGDRHLIYALVVLGISVLDFDWRHQFHPLDQETKLILDSIKRTQRKGKPLKIPRDILRTFQEIRAIRPPIETNQPACSSQECQSTRPINPGRTPGTTEHNDAQELDHPRAGIWVGEHFVEDYEPDLDQTTTTTHLETTSTPMIGCEDSQIDNNSPGLDSLPKPTPLANLPQTSSTNHLQRKLNLLKSLKNHTVQPIKHSSSPKSSPTPPSPPHPTLPTHSILINSSSTNNPQNSNLDDMNLSFNVQICNLPIDASQQSILFFIQNGPDIFKMARTQNQKIDALGRNLQKFKNNFWPQGKAKENDRSNKYSCIKEADIKFINQSNSNNRACQKSQTIIINFNSNQFIKFISSLNYNNNNNNPLSLTTFVNNFILDFHKKKFFPSDLLCQPISCQLIPN